MSELTLFNSMGSFVYPDESEIAALSSAERERFEAVRLAYEASAVADKALAEATAKVQTDMAAISDVEQQLKTFPAPTFLDLHRQTFSGPGSRHPGKY